MASTGQGVTMGAHRMWSHKTFKARFIVRLVLIILQTISGQVRNILFIFKFHSYNIEKKRNLYLMRVYRKRENKTNKYYKHPKTHTIS